MQHVRSIPNRVLRSFPNTAHLRPHYASPSIFRSNFSAAVAVEEAPAYTLEDVKQLRSISGAPLKECKKALSSIDTEATDRISEALDWLRIRGQSIAQQKSCDVAKYGFIGMFKGETTASLVEVNCVTDFVENNPIFQEAVLNIGNTVMKSDLKSNEALSVEEISNIPVIDFNSDAVKTQCISESLTDIVSSIRENLVFRRAFRMECSASGVINGYLHGRKTDNLGMKGSLVSLETDCESMSDAVRENLNNLGKDIATHIVANYPQPKYIRREELTEEMIEKEKGIVLQTIMEKGGDAQNAEIVQKQIDGRMKKFYAENVLMEQPFCLEDDNKLTIEKLVARNSKELGCDIKVTNMVVYNLGEA